jgi:hypothetical protein
MADIANKEEVLEMIAIIDSKDDLEELILSVSSIDLNKRKSLENLKIDAIAIVNGTYEDPNAQSEEVFTDQAEEGSDADVNGLIGELSAGEANEPSSPEPITTPAKKVVAGHISKYLRKKGGRVVNWSPSLAKRSDMFECDIDGKATLEFEEVEA